MSKVIQVLVIDDSHPDVEVLQALFSSPDFSISATANDPYEAAECLREAIPDVIVLDVSLPRMDGLTFIRKLMEQYPIPTVVCSNFAPPGSKEALEAIDAGAFEVIAKPKSLPSEEQAEHLRDIVRAASRSHPAQRRSSGRVLVTPKYDAGVIMPTRPPPDSSLAPEHHTIVIGASTGGTEALACIFSMLPAETPPIVVVQHMPGRFTKMFAERLNTLSAMEVREAHSGDQVRPGLALLAPGGAHHLVLRRHGTDLIAVLDDGPPVQRHRPSVDVLFRSAVQAAGRHVTGVLLTGMGDDGARGLLELRLAGAHTIAQNRESSVVFGMPGEAVRLGAASEVLPLDLIAHSLTHAA